MKWRYYLIRMFSWIVCLLPYPIILSIGCLLGKLLYLAAASQRKRALKQCQECLDVDDAQAQAIIKRQFCHLGQNVMEILYTPRLNKQNVSQFVEFDHKPILDQALGQHKGVIYLTAHLGNWEWMGAALALYGYPVASIVKPQRNDQYTKVLNEYREMTGIEVFSKGTSEVISAVKALKGGKVLGFFADQDGGKNGLFVPFFGIMSSTHAGVATFANKLKSPVVPAFIVRTKRGHKIIVKEPLVLPNTGSPEKNIYEMTVLATQVIEEVIREYPDEWLWFQKRWNTKPGR